MRGRTGKLAKALSGPRPSWLGLSNLHQERNMVMSPHLVCALANNAAPEVWMGMSSGLGVADRHACSHEPRSLRPGPLRLPGRLGSRYLLLNHKTRAARVLLLCPVMSGPQGGRCERWRGADSGRWRRRRRGCRTSAGGASEGPGWAAGRPEGREGAAASEPRGGIDEA